MKKVLIITYYWPPAGGAGVQRWLKLSKYLFKYGVEPIILTVDEQIASYPQIDKSMVGEVPDALEVIRTNSFEPLQIYAKIAGKDNLPYGGFVNQKMGWKSKVLRFIRGNLFIPDSRRGWNRYAFNKAKEIIHSRNIHTIITTSPPHSTQLIGLKLKNQLGVYWISDLRDPWTDIYFYDELYHIDLVKRLDKKLEKKVLRGADKILTVSKSLASLYKQKIPGSADKISILHNGYDPEDFVDQSPIINKKFSSLFTIVYTGTISSKYPLKGLIDALKHFIYEAGNREIKLTFVGTVSPEIRESITENNLGPYVEYIDYVPHKVSIQYLMKSDMLLLVIPEAKENRGILTGKLFEYLAAGKPIMGIGPVEGDAAEIVRDCKAGSFFAPDDSKGIVNYIGQLYSKMNLVDKGLFHMQSQDYNNRLKYSRETQAGELAEIIE